MVYVRLILIESLGTEALVPNSTALVVKGSVTGSDDGGPGKEEVVERGFDAFAAGAIDISHG